MDVTAVVPLKALALAKRRLAASLDAAARKELVAFMAHRVLDACLAAPSVSGVLAVAGDEEAAAVLRRAGVDVLLEPRPGLRVALAAADAAAGAARATLVLPADLPAATGEDVEAVCAAAAAAPCAVVVPAEDGGTAALLRSPPLVFEPAFGRGSCHAHLELARSRGIAPVVLRLGRLAVDVDDPAGLRRAADLEPALGRWLASGTTLHGDDDAGDAGADMPQGTVKHFDIETNTGTILLDDQDELALDAETFAASGLIELRLGQRVRFDVEDADDGRRISRITIVSL